jgi:hypothetical protein
LENQGYGTCWDGCFDTAFEVYSVGRCIPEPEVLEAAQEAINRAELRLKKLKGPSYVSHSQNLAKEFLFLNIIP